MELRLYAQMLQRGWWIIVLAALSALNVSLVASMVATPVYRASARFVVSPNETLITGRDVVTSLEALDKRSIVSTYAEVLNSLSIYNQTVAGMGLTAEDVAGYSHTTVALPDANVLEFSVEGPDPQRVVELTNRVGQQAIDYIRGLYQVYDINFLDTAKVPEAPIRPQPIRDGTLALGLGVVVGAVLAIVREQVRTPIEEFLQRAAIDGESGAYTRRHIEQRLEQLTMRRRGSTLSLGLVQLEGLQDLIGMMPQPIVQKLLREVTQTLRYELRGNDLVGRWGDSDFALLLPDTPGQAAVGTLGRIQIALSKPFVLSVDGETVRMFPTVGIADRQGEETAMTIVSRAEKALEEATKLETRLSLFKTTPFVNA